MGRGPITLTQAQKSEVETLAAVLSTEQIADYFGIGRQTFWDIMARDAEVAIRYKRGKARAIGAIAQGLIQKARSGDTTSMIFFLKTQAGWRETSGLAHSIDPGTREDSAKAAAEFTARIAEMAARMHEPAPATLIEGRASGADAP